MAVEAPAEQGTPSLAPSMSASDLSEVIGAFNDVSARLQRTHEALCSQVARLNADLKSANEQLERSRRLAALGQMAAGIAHEVRNPLGAICLHARLLREDLAGQPEQRRVADKILSAVRAVDAVVVDVLAFAREARMNPTPCDASALLSGALEECMEDAAPSVEVCRNDLGREPTTVECDAHLMTRALVNVIRNALQAMPGGDGRGGRRGRLTLDVRREAAGNGAQPFVTFSVLDTGPGIPPEVMQRMFNPFFTTRSAGTGLGLSIVHRILDAHRGRIVVRNAGEGERDVGGAVVELAIPERSGAERGGNGESQEDRS